MKTTLHFVHTEAPQEVRENIEAWLDTYLGEFKSDENMNLELFCSKESSNGSLGPAKFKCVVSAKAPWMTKALTVKSFGQGCWQTILDACHRLRQLIHKKRNYKLSRRHDTPRVRHFNFTDGILTPSPFRLFLERRVTT